MKKEVIIIGAGPAGTAAAMFLLKEGIKPLIIEQERFPRYHIGESLTGEGGRVLRILGLEKQMMARNFPVKYGVRVFGQSDRSSWYVPVKGRDENWQLFPFNTWQVRRDEFDRMMLDEAINRGAEFRIAKAKSVIHDNHQKEVKGIIAENEDGVTEELRSDLVIDCTGQATWLANQGITGPKYLGAYDKQIAIFGQIKGGTRVEGKGSEFERNNTLIFYKQKYQWAWFIPIDEDVVSVGVVIPSDYFIAKKESKRDFLIRELKELHPKLKDLTAGATLLNDVHVVPNYSYQVREFCGKGFICLGDAHRFIDPIFSFGVTVSLREAQFAAPFIKQYLAGELQDKENPFFDYQLFCEKGIDILEDIVDTFWDQPNAFAYFVYLRYPEHVLDIFAGRVYETEKQPSVAINAFREFLKRKDEREISYAAGKNYSVPIGSRFHPERAALWKPTSLIESTEEWMGPR